MKDLNTLSRAFHDNFSRYAWDLYPGRYDAVTCQLLAEQAVEIRRLAQEKKSLILVHYYLYPEFHEIADKLGDSLALSAFAKEQKAERVDFQAVAFMGQTAKILTDMRTRVFIADTPKVLGCSLVFGTDHRWLEEWKRQNPDGIVVTYINSDPYTKALSDYISTSRNTGQIIAHAAVNNPGKKILFLPDKFLGTVMRARALKILAGKGVKINEDLIEIYDRPFGGFNACCYVHEKLGNDSITVAMLENPEAELMIHPECGCSSFCLAEVEKGSIPQSRAFFLSTEQMIQRAKESPAKKFIVATEAGLVYALRKQVPDKEFTPVSTQAHCDFMKSNTFEKLVRSLREDRLEIVICNDCKNCSDPLAPYEDGQHLHIPRRIADSAKIGIERMLAIT